MAIQLISTKFNRIDFCRHRGLTRVDKTLTAAAPYNTGGTTFQGAVGLGCSLFVSHNQNTSLSVLTEFDHRTGNVVRELLVGFNDANLGLPTASPWLQAVRDRFLEGVIANPFSANPIDLDFVTALDGIPWVQSDTLFGLSTMPNISAIVRRGHGGISQRRTAIVDGTKEFVTDNVVMPFHRHKLYALVGTQSNPSDSSSLLYDADEGWYAWPRGTGVQSFNSSASEPVGAGVRSFNIQIRIWGVQPVVTASPDIPYNSLANNGPGQSRGFGYFLVDDQVAPGYGQGMTGGLNIGGLRQGCYVYGNRQTVGPSNAQVLLNGQTLAFAPFLSPTPQTIDEVLPVSAPADTLDIFADRTVGTWTFQVANHGISFEPDPKTVGTFVFDASPSSQPGLLYEAYVIFSRTDTS